MMMRVVQFEGSGRPLLLVERPVPRPGQALVKVVACAVCGFAMPAMCGRPIAVQDSERGGHGFRPQASEALGRRHE